MDDDKFVLSKSNIVMIVITVLLFIGLIVTTILLCISLNDPIDPLPDLSTTAGRTSSSATSSTTVTTTTTQATTTRALVSPYYDVDLSNILDNDLFKKKNLTADEIKEISHIYIKTMNSIYLTDDYSIYNTKIINDHAKDGESDKISINGKTYIEMYDLDNTLQKIMYRNRKSVFLNLYKGDDHIFMENNGKYYRLYDEQPVNVDFRISTTTIESNANDKAKVVLRYYDGNYKSKGYSNPNYQKLEFTMIYDDNFWKVYEMDYLLYNE